MNRISGIPRFSGKPCKNSVQANNDATFELIKRKENMPLFRKKKQPEQKLQNSKPNYSSHDRSAFLIDTPEQAHQTSSQQIAGELNFQFRLELDMYVAGGITEEQLSAAFYYLL